MNFVDALGVILLILSQVTNTVGKGGSSSNVVVSPVTITQIGASGIGTNVKLRCDFPSVQNPNSLFWFKANDIIYAEQDNALYISNNVEVSTENFKVTKSHYIIIKDASLDDSTTYTCQVKPKTKAEVEGELALVITPHAKTVMPMVNLILACERHHIVADHAITTDHLIWKKGKSIITFGGSVIDSNPRFSLKNTSLVVKNVTASDSASYTCYLNGKRSDSVTITVYTQPIVVLSPLRGYRGIVFGALLGISIVCILAVTCYIQNKPFKGAKEFVIDEE